LVLYGNDALIEDSTALGSNSALTRLADIAGQLYLENGASVSTTGALTNTGTLVLGANSFSSTESVTAKSLVNSGTVDLAGGNGGSLATLNVSGAITNNGSISISIDTEELAGAVGGAGSFSLDSANLQFDSSVSAGQTITETNINGTGDALTLKEAQNFAGTISGFGTGDTIDATNFLLSGTTFNFVENSGGTGGKLALTDKSLDLTANIHMTGVYSNSDFTLSPDSGTGTLVKFV
jgi:filamentous hemagglutinin